MHKAVSVILAILVIVFYINCSDEQDCIDGQENDIIDADGNVYSTITIGKQIWTVENWRSTKYNDGTAIPHLADSIQWRKNTPGYCFFNNATDVAYREKYGALYNWQAVNTGKIAPKGWRVPTDADWTKLEKYLIAKGYNWDGSKEGKKIAMALAANTDWDYSREPGAVGYDLRDNNTSGFTGFSVGTRNPGGMFSRYYYGKGAYWWTATEYDEVSAYCRALWYNYDYLTRKNLEKGFGYPLRLVRDRYKYIRQK